MLELRRLRLGLKTAIGIQAFRTRKGAVAPRTSAPVVTFIASTKLEGENNVALYCCDCVQRRIVAG